MLALIITSQRKYFNIKEIFYRCYFQPNWGEIWGGHDLFKVQGIREEAAWFS